jgi:HEAT repeat protein
MRLPGAGQLLVVAAAACAAWLFWSESRDRGWIPGVAPRPADAANEGHDTETFDSLELPSTSELIVALSDTRDSAARRKALLQLSSIGPDATEAIGAIRDRLKDEHAGVRYAAVFTLWRVSQDAEFVMPELSAMLEDRSGAVRDVTAETFAAIGRPATGLVLQMLHSDSPVVRSQALLILQRIVCPDTFSEISDAIENVCHDPNPGVRTAAVIACVQLGFIEIPKLRALLQTDITVPAVQTRYGRDRNSRDVAVEAIAWLGPEAADLVPDLITLLENIPVWEVKSSGTQAGPQFPGRTFAPRVQSILRTFSVMKTVAHPAVPYLLGRLNALDSNNRLAMIGTLIDIGAEPGMFTPQLTALIGKSDSNEDFWAWCKTATWAGTLLVRADPAESRRQVSLLIPKLADSNKPIDQVALHALLGLDREASQAVPLLISLLSNPGASSEATMMLGNLGPAAAPAGPVLIAILEQAQIKGDIQHHITTVDALGDIGPAAQSAVPLLLTLLDEPEPKAPPKNVTARGEQPTYFENVANVLSALGKIANDSPEVQMAIRGQLTSKSILRRAVAVHALAGSTKDVSQVLLQIVEILKNDTSGFVRAHAALAIAAMSGDREQAVASLAEALGDSDADVRKTAAVALGSMGPAVKSTLPALRQAWLEARCGIPGAPASTPSQTPFVLRRDHQELPQLPLAQALRQALTAIDRAE